MLVVVGLAEAVTDRNLDALAIVLGMGAVPVFSAARRLPAEVDIPRGLSIKWETRHSGGVKVPAAVVRGQNGAELCWMLAADHFPRQLAANGRWKGRHVATDAPIGADQLRLRVEGELVGSASRDESGEVTGRIRFGSSNATFVMEPKGDVTSDEFKWLRESGAHLDNEEAALCAAWIASRQSRWLS